MFNEQRCNSVLLLRFSVTFTQGKPVQAVLHNAISPCVSVNIPYVIVKPNIDLVETFFGPHEETSLKITHNEVFCECKNACSFV